MEKAKDNVEANSTPLSTASKPHNLPQPIQLYRETPINMRPSSRKRFLVPEGYSEHTLGRF